MRQLLVRAREVDQMMKVVGEEGTALEDYLIYLKGELFDAVFLQQNAFDPVDAATPAERQRRVFALLEDIMHAPLALRVRDDARRFFHKLRQHLLDLNGSDWNSDEFRQVWSQVREHFESRVDHEAAGSGPVLRPALIETDLDSPITRPRRMRPESHKDLLFSEEEDEAHHD